jgi:hypothetical protein
MTMQKWLRQRLAATLAAPVLAIATVRFPLCEPAFLVFRKDWPARSRRLQPALSPASVIRAFGRNAP